MLALADNILRIINFLFLVISIGLISSLLNTQHRHSSRVNYCMFACFWTLCSLSLPVQCWPLVSELTHVTTAHTLTVTRLLKVPVPDVDKLKPLLHSSTSLVPSFWLRPWCLFSTWSPMVPLVLVLSPREEELAKSVFQPFPKSNWSAPT